MRITVIGHLCLDLIQHPDGTETRSYGGIFFAIAALANLLGPNERVMPVFGVGRDEYDALLDRLSVYPNVDTSGIYRFSGPTNQVRLTYRDDGNRVECSEHIAEPIPLKKIRQYLDTDLVLVNMISGFDVTLETLDEIRMEVRENHVPVYLDIHSLTLGVKDDGTRFHRPVDAWRRWLFMLHAVQLNEEEAAILTPEHLDEGTLAKHTLALNTKALLVTRGARGVSAFIDSRKQTTRHDIVNPDVQGPSIDPTGCGDVFGAAYCAHYLSAKDILSSVEFANRVAGAKARFAGSTDIDQLASFRLEQIQREESNVQ